MVKKTRSRKQSKNRRQNGGAWYNPLSWGQSEDPYAPKKSWGDWFSNSTSGITSGASNLVNGTENLLGSATNSITSGAQNAWKSTTGLLSSEQPIASEQPYQTEQPIASVTVQPINNQPLETEGQQIIGGTRKKHSTTIKYKTNKNKQMRGGKGGLGLTYYASPVSDLKVAQPTYWEVYGDGHIMKAGTKRRKHGYKNNRRSRRNKRH